MAVHVCIVCAMLSALSLNEAYISQMTAMDTNAQTGRALLRRFERGLVDKAVLFGRRAIKVLLRNARFQDTDRGTKYYEKQGGYVEAKADFKSLNPKNVHTYAKHIKVGEVGDRKVYIRNDKFNVAVSITDKNGKNVDVEILYRKLDKPWL